MIRPLYDRVVVSPTRENKSEGGLHLPDIASADVQRGRVVAAGEGRLLFDGTVVPLRVRVGDHVLWPQSAGIEVKRGGEAVRVLREDELLGVDV